MTGALPDLDFVVDELLLEGLSGVADKKPARACAIALRSKVSLGADLSPHIGRLLGFIRDPMDPQVLADTVKALGQYAMDREDVALVRAIAAASDACRDALLGVSLRSPAGGAKPAAPSVLVCLRDLVAGAPQDTRALFVHFVERSASAEGDVSPAIDVLVSLLGIAPSGAGRHRRDPSFGARRCLLLGMVLGPPQVEATFRPRLEALARGEPTPASDDARRVLVSVAAYRGHWADVDALTDARRDALARLGQGLVSAIYELGWQHQVDLPQAVRDRIVEGVNRLEALKPKLSKKALAELDRQLRHFGHPVRRAVERARAGAP
jgi:hypothetical protein